MAPFPLAVTLNIGRTEAEAEANARAICAEAEVAFSGPNARQVALEVLAAYINRRLARTTPPPKAEGLS